MADSAYQKAVFAFIKGEPGYEDDAPVEWDAPLPEYVNFHGKKNLIVEAVAGSGKTTTIVKALQFMNKRQLATASKGGNFEDLFGGTRNPKVLFVAFNKHIADELARRVPSYVTASTLNSVGWGICRGATKCELDKYKDDNILKTFMDLDDADMRKLYYKVKGSVSKMVGLFKALILKSEAEIHEQFDMIADRYDVAIPENSPDFIFREIVLKVWRKSVDVVRYMSFDDQKHAPIFNGWPTPTYDWVIGDEYQDWAKVDRELVKQLGRKGQIAAVGDRHQCQPAGTLVDVVVRKGARWNDGAIIEKRPIELLRRGDTVVSYDAKYGEWRRSDTVLETASREYVGDLIRVTTADGSTSTYTPSHKCHVSFSNLRDRLCIYLMRRGNQFRIGKTSIAYGTGQSNGPCGRMRAENGDALWILKLCDDSVEAFIEEQVISARFGLPQLTFNRSNVSKLPQDEINYAWHRIGDNTDRALKCLESFGRDINYPFTTSTKETNRIKRPFVTQACNLLDGSLVLPNTKNSLPMHAPDGGQRGATVLQDDWVPAKVTREHYEGQVHSLRIANNHNYVADSILTSNSIYGFRGADPEGTTALIEELDALVLPLSICFRCPDAVIEEAQKIVPHIEKPLNNQKGQGIVDTISTEEFLRRVGPGEFVLCRTTAPLVKRCLELIGRKKKAVVKGRDIGQGLLDFLENLEPSPHTPVDEFLDRLRAYKLDKIERLSKAGRDSESQAVEDKCDTLEVLAMDCNRTGDIRKLIDTVFSDTDSQGTTFCTIHRSKGLEADVIYLLRRDLLPHPKSKKPIQLEQEANLEYVAITRSQCELYFVTKEKDER